MTNVMGHTSRGTFLQENTTLAKYRIAKHGSDDQEVVAAVDATAQIIGVTDESASGVADEEVTLVMLGVAKVTILAATTKGAPIIATTAGKGATTSNDNDFCVGYLLETTTVANQVAKVMVNPFMFGTI